MMSFWTTTVRLHRNKSVLYNLCINVVFVFEWCSV